MSQVPQLTGKAAMPAPGSKKAPPTFDGEEDHIAEFLDIYERCIDDAQLPQPDWVPFMFRYLTRSQRDIFEAFDGFETADWTSFKSAIEESFAGAFKTKRHTLASLDNFVRVSASTPITVDSQLRAYHRQFQAITTYLVRNKDLADTDRARLYWFGLHPDTRLAVERRLAITIPDHPRSKPFPVSDVYKAGCYVFDANAFDLNLPLAHMAPTKMGDANKLGGTSSSQEIRTTVQLPTVPTGPPPPEELDTLVRRLASLRVNEVEYATTYARLIFGYPQLADVIRRPATFNTHIPAATTAGTMAVPRICPFCKAITCPSRSPWFCPIGMEYVRAGKVIQFEGWYRWPDKSRIESHPQGLKYVIDKALSDRAAAASPPTNPSLSQTLFFEVDPMPLQTTPDAIPDAIGFIEEITHSSESIPTGQASHLAATASLDQSGRGSPVPPSNAKSWKATDKKMAGQFQYKSKVEDNTMAQQLYDWALASLISVMPGELLAISPDIRRLFVDSCRVNRIPVYSATGEVSSELPTTSVLMATPVPMYTAPIMELDVQLSGKHPEVALYDTGAELVCISTAAANELRLPFNPDLKIRMRDANGSTKTTFGVVENLEIGINGIAVIVHAWIIDNPPYRLLLG